MDAVAGSTHSPFFSSSSPGQRQSAIGSVQIEPPVQISLSLHDLPGAARKKGNLVENNNNNSDTHAQKFWHLNLEASLPQFLTGAGQDQYRQHVAFATLPSKEYRKFYQRCSYFASLQGRPLFTQSLKNNLELYHTREETCAAICKNVFVGSVCSACGCSSSPAPII